MPYAATSSFPCCLLPVIASYQYAAMPDTHPYEAEDIEDSGEQEQSSLLAAENEGNGHAKPPQRAPLQRQSSIVVHPPPDGAPRTPRTSNRVRFDIDERSNGGLNGHALSPREEEEEWLEEDDYLGARRSITGQRAPLLTDIEAPSITAALEFNAEDLLESARPKSGMRSAFMNMANSIIGAGIIGQPYAFRQAGLTMGVLLLVVLTVTVDWTIRLIVVNSKLSGADSFQGTMEHCFGKSGLVAISVAQFAFAFGGMLAFCIIIGDTIPNVVAAIFPSLPDTPFLWLLTNRRAVIVLFVLCFSYPLSLYRDIAKVRLLAPFRIMYIANEKIVSEGVNVGINKHGCMLHRRSLVDFSLTRYIGDSFHDYYARRQDTRRSQGKPKRIPLFPGWLCSGSWSHCIRFRLPYELEPHPA